MTDTEILTAPEQANLIAAQAVAVATSFLDGRSDACTLARAASCIRDDIEKLAPDPRSHAIVDATRLMVTAMNQASIEPREIGQGGAGVMAALVSLLRRESNKLAASGAQRQ